MRDVEWIAAEGEYVRLHADTTTYLQRGSLSEAVAGFARFGFLRVHRSAAVNTNQIAALERGPWGALSLRMRSGAEVPVGKKHRAGVQAMIGRGARG